MSSPQITKMFGFPSGTVPPSTLQLHRASVAPTGGGSRGSPTDAGSPLLAGPRSASYGWVGPARPPRGDPHAASVPGEDRARRPRLDLGLAGVPRRPRPRRRPERPGRAVRRHRAGGVVTVRRADQHADDGPP